ncbi:programmed cell death 1 ligand 1-like isoform X2 [Dicentrarchus labrax]|uniref:programmed cell death 1 ligand 1-like isoform X2 n=1 Tax=Dicentrarchus labrax TaxID=13489 RepID=UPI0021F62788|nr:programmed cell death 1 ligand 1-like isoform X2 [Dicentrarchus labrax]
MCAGINSLLPSGESESKDRVGGRKTATNDNSLYPAAEMKLLLVLMSSLSLVDADSDVIGSDKPVTVTVSDNVILPCHLEPPFNVRNLTVEWKRGETIVHIYTNRKDDPGRQDKNFRGRTSVFHEEMIRGNISLKLTSITELDAGSYTCFVPKLQSQVRRGFVNLTVEPVEQKKDKGSPTHKNNRQPENVGNDTAAIIGIAVVIIAGTVISFVVVLWGLCRNTSKSQIFFCLHVYKCFQINVSCL